MTAAPQAWSVCLELSTADAGSLQSVRQTDPSGLQVWVTIAAKLNYDIVRLNTGSPR